MLTHLFRRQLNERSGLSTYFSRKIAGAQVFQFQSKAHVRVACSNADEDSSVASRATTCKRPRDLQRFSTKRATSFRPMTAQAERSSEALAGVEKESTCA